MVEKGIKLGVPSPQSSSFHPATPRDTYFASNFGCASRKKKCSHDAKLNIKSLVYYQSSSWAMKIITLYVCGDFCLK